MRSVTDDSPDEWERRYNTSIEAEHERQERVPGKVDLVDAYLIFVAFVVPATLIAVGLGFLGSKIGSPYWVGAGITFTVLGLSAALGVYRWWRDRPT